MKIRHMNGSTPLPETTSAGLERLTITHSIELSDAKYKEYTNSKYFTETRVKTAAEITAQEAAEQEEQIKIDTATEEKDILLKDLVKVIKNLRARVKALEDA